MLARGLARPPQIQGVAERLLRLRRAAGVLKELAKIVQADGEVLPVTGVVGMLGLQRREELAGGAVGLLGRRLIAEHPLDVAHAEVGAAGLAAHRRVVALVLEELFLKVQGPRQQFTADLLHARLVGQTHLADRRQHLIDGRAGILKVPLRPLVRRLGDVP